jgi:DNA-binding transcriptional ArsR family regulator
MARAATTTDPFNAVAEPRRRQILDALVSGERSVGELVASLDLAQPQVSKHLKVLHEVGLVEARREGRRRLYRIDGGGLREIHEWAGSFESLWQERLDLLDAVVTELKQANEGDDADAQ